MRKSLFSFATVLVASFLPLWGQSYQGGVRGTLSDAAGAALPTAKVTLTDQATNVVRTTLTNATGEYTFTAVDPAVYSLVAEAPGFKKLERKGVTIGTQEFLNIDLKLELGAVTDSVEVTGDVPLIETANASNGTVIDHQKMADLPILGRNPFLFSKLSPNVTPVGDPRFNRFQDQSGSSAISVGGGPINGNNYLLDGVPITDFSNRAVIIPSIEAVQEVKLQNNTYDAEMGRTAGGVFNTFLKSGSNDFHGSLFGYTRQSDWLANNFFLNASGQPRPETPFYNWGGSLGGAVIIPKVYNGKNKTFFWVADESYRQKSPLTNTYSVPTALERVGDFSQSKTTIYNPFSGVRNADGTITRTPFAGNVIPANLLNPVGLKIASLFPLPSFAPSSLGAPDYFGSDILTDRADEFTSKVDHEVFSWWHVNASYLHYKSREPSGNLLNNLTGSGSNLLYRKVDSTQLNNIFTPNPTTVVSIRYGFNRFPNRVDEISQGFVPASLGFTGPFAGPLQSYFFPQVTFQNYVTLGDNGNSQSVFWSKNLLGSVSKYVGRHSLKAGIDYRLIHVDFTDLSNASGTFGFDNTFTGASGTGVAGSDIVALLVGAPSSGSVGTASKLNTFVRYYAGYVQDDFRLNNKLTLNFGVRYEYETGLGETRNQYVIGFDRTIVNPIAANVTGVVPRGAVIFAGQNGAPNTCCVNQKNRFAPRIGVAYAMDSKTTIRGGWGVFYAPTIYSSSSSYAPGFGQSTPVVQSNDGNLTPATNLTNPFPAGIQQPVGSQLGYLQGIGTSVTVIDQNRRIGVVQQYSFDIQRQLPGGIALEVGYVGALSRHLQPKGNININQLRPVYFSQGSALRNSVANPFFGHGGTGVIGSSTISQSQLLRDFPEFSSVNVATDLSRARYDSLIAKAQKRFSAGLTFLTSFTWSRNMDSEFGSSNFLNASGGTQPQNAFDIEAEYSRAVNDIPLRLTNAVTYDLPFGTGKQYLHDSKFLNYAVGDWQLNIVNTFQTGSPLAIYQSTNNNTIIGAGIQRPNATGVSPAISGDLESRLNGYINPLAFSTAPAFTFGNVSRTIPYRGPGMANWDISLFKSFVIKERLKGQFRAETLNTFNTPLFRAPNTAYGSSSFGKITQQANYPRYIQLGVRFFF